MKKRWHERSIKYHAAHVAEIEEEKKKNEEERLRLVELKKANAIKRAQRNHAVDVAEQCYNTLIQNHAQDYTDTSPLLLDSVITPVSETHSCSSPESMLHRIHCREQVQSAREERDRALSLAQQYRNLAEASQLEKRTLKVSLKGKWKLYVTSGATRLLKATPIRKDSTSCSDKTVVCVFVISIMSITCIHVYTHYIFYVRVYNLSCPLSAIHVLSINTVAPLCMNLLYNIIVINVL